MKSEVPPHALGFPFNLRRGLGLWHKLYVDGGSFMPVRRASAELNRGAYLVRAPGHCVECHSSRNLIGGIVKATEFAGAPNPEREGVVPNITSDDGIGDWSEAIAYLLQTGNTPDFDTVGDNMVPVQENMAKLTPRTARRSPKSLPPRPDAVRRAARGEGGEQ